MAELIKVAEKDSDITSALVNSVALTIAAGSLAFTIAAWQENDRFLAKFNGTVAFLSSSIAEFVNRQTKSEVAIAQMAKDSEIELIAHNIQAQKKAQVANLSVAAKKQSAEVKVSSAHIEARQRVQLAQLTAEVEDSIDQIQEYEEYEEPPLQTVEKEKVAGFPFLKKAVSINKEEL